VKEHASAFLFALMKETRETLLGITGRTFLILPTRSKLEENRRLSRTVSAEPADSAATGELADSSQTADTSESMEAAKTMETTEAAAALPVLGTSLPARR
jgi:hypothetical protein